MGLLTKNGKELNVTFVNPNTQKAQQMIDRYVRSDDDSIFKAYGRPSSAKVYAFNEIAKEKSDVNGTGLFITGAGSDVFSCAYQVEDKDGKNYLIYHTHVNRYAIPY